MKRALPLVLLVSCAAPPPPESATPPPPDPAVLRTEARAALAALERSFYEHWGSVERSAPYARLRPEHVPFLRELADANGDHALMALRVLAKLAPAERFSDAARAILYAGALERETNYARWGMITPRGFLPGVYGAELLALKGAAAPYLQKLLADRRRAPVAGGEGERTSRLQGDRVCDYAWVFLATIFDRPLVYYEDPGLRDEQIRQLDLWLDRRR
jgi:hypothetical protein